MVTRCITKWLSRQLVISILTLSDIVDGSIAVYLHYAVVHSGVHTETCWLEANVSVFFVRTHVWHGVCLYEFVRACVHIKLFTSHTSTRQCVRTHTCACTYTCTHIHTHTHTYALHINFSRSVNTIVILCTYLMDGGCIVMDKNLK